jgi:hypothetical protein
VYDVGDLYHPKQSLETPTKVPQKSNRRFQICYDVKENENLLQVKQLLDFIID